MPIKRRAASDGMRRRRREKGLDKEEGPKYGENVYEVQMVEEESWDVRNIGLRGEKDWAVHRSQCIELELPAVHVSHKTGEAVMMLWRRT